MAWSHVASVQPAEPSGLAPAAAAPIRREDEAARLRARLLQLIESHEHSRKAAASEARRPR
ncbi:MAG: hypothetical protein DCC67_16705 [Planctomycetota bacterium]|nr:MAG: hypothetical protein DCC67_16705 [Planctomycetota bacterium]